MSNPEAHYAPFLTTEQVIVKPIATLSLVFLVQGIYCVVFGLGLRALLRRKDHPNRKLFLGCIIALFVTITIVVIFGTHLIIREAIIFYVAAKSHSYKSLADYLHGDTLKTLDTAVINIVQVLSVIIADSMLVHRCYFIWGRSKPIAIVLILLMFITNGWSLADNIVASYAISNTRKPALLQLAMNVIQVDVWNNVVAAIANLTMSVLTAARIWWITREARVLMGKATNSRYKQMIVILLESGALFPAAMIIDATITVISNYGAKGIPVELDNIIYQMAGIAPTLIMARSASGKAVESVDQVVESSLHFAENNVLGSRRSVDVRIHTVDIEQAVGRGEESKL